MSGPVLETPRLILRVPVAEDHAAWSAFMADAEAVRFVGGAQPPVMAWRSLTSTAGSWALHGFGMFSVVEKSSGTWIGRVGPWFPADWPGREVGWSLARAAWGKGYAFEAVSAAMDWTFDVLGWADVIHPIHPENERSRALARRLGSRLLGPTRLPKPFDEHALECWGQDAAGWRAARIGTVAQPTP